MEGLPTPEAGVQTSSSDSESGEPDERGSERTDVVSEQTRPAIGSRSD